MQKVFESLKIDWETEMITVTFLGIVFCLKYNTENFHQESYFLFIWITLINFCHHIRMKLMPHRDYGQNIMSGWNWPGQCFSKIWTWSIVSLNVVSRYIHQLFLKLHEFRGHAFGKIILQWNTHSPNDHIRQISNMISPYIPY